MPNTPIVISAASVIDGLLLFVDGYPDEQHRLTTRTGSEPLEDGREVTDLAVAEPAELRFTAAVSDFGGASGARNPREAWGEIRRIHVESELMAIVTEWGTYENMLITSATATPAGRGMSVDLEVTEVLIAGQVTIQARTSGPAANRTEEIAQGRVAVVPLATGDSRDPTTAFQRSLFQGRRDPRDPFDRLTPFQQSLFQGRASPRTDPRDLEDYRVSANQRRLFRGIPDVSGRVLLQRAFERRRAARQAQEDAAEHDVESELGDG